MPSLYPEGNAIQTGESLVKNNEKMVGKCFHTIWTVGNEILNR